MRFAASGWGCGLLLLATLVFGLASGRGQEPAVTGQDRLPPQSSRGPGVDGRSTEVPVDVHRSPWMVAGSPSRHWVAVSNSSAGSISLIDARTRRVADELRVGPLPRSCCWLDDQFLAVAVSGLDEVVLLECSDGTLSLSNRWRVGDEPTGLCRIGSDRLAVTLRGEDCVLLADLGEDQPQWQRLSVSGYPEHVALAPNGQWLVTVCGLPGEVFVHQVTDGRLLSRRIVMDDGYRPGNPLIPADSSRIEMACLINRHRPVEQLNITRGWVLDNRLVTMRLPDEPFWKQRQIGLDLRADAIGDVHWGALSPDESLVVLACGGTHELVVLDRERIRWPPGNTEDFLPSQMEDDPLAYRRIKLGGRPLGLSFIDRRMLAVANYLRDSVQWVDIEKLEVVDETPLGSPPTISLARRGETIFHDADRSIHSWFSCHTCHPDGHTSGQLWDTVNDDSYDTDKLTPSLRGVTRTGPWTWHGWQKSLAAAMHKSLTDTLSTQQDITDLDVQALVAFLETLEHPPNPQLAPDGRLTERQQTGRELFQGKAGCVRCHAGSEFTSDEVYEVGLGSSRSFYSGYNPPTLRGVSTRRRFLHDGRAESLRDVLTRFHAPERTGGERLDSSELNALLDYLGTL